MNEKREIIRQTVKGTALAIFAAVGAFAVGFTSCKKRGGEDISADIVTREYNGSVYKKIGEKVTLADVV